MADLIDRQTLIKEMEKQLGVLVDTYYERYGSSGLAHTSGFAEAIDYAYLAPAVDAVEVSDAANAYTATKE